MRKRSNSFKLLWQAIWSSRESMWASIQVLIVLTVALATVFYLAEHKVQPKEYDYWRSLLWAFTRYIGDPGQFAGNGPVTLVGRVVASLIGIVGILIFAVPAGLIGAGFKTAIEKELRKKHLKELGERLHKAFRRKQDSKTMFRCVPRYISIGTLQASKNMTERDVIDAVEHNPPFRLRNLATAETKGNHAIDQIVIEMFPFNTFYGAYIDRGSNITICCPTANTEAGIGNFAYYLAIIGGFNFISKEVENNVDEPSSYYLINNEVSNAEREKYLNDLRHLSGKGKDRWTIFLISSESKKETDLHFITKANSKTGRESTIIDNEKFVQLWDVITQSVKQECDVLTDLDSYRPAGPKNVAVVVGGGIDINAFTIRVSSELAVWNPIYVALVKTLAETINTTIGNPEKATPYDLLKESGVGYQEL